MTLAGGRLTFPSLKSARTYLKCWPSGDTYLGGDDFDQKIIDHIKSIFEKETGLDVSSDLNAMQAIKEAAENAKKHLSTDTMANIHIPAFLEDANGEAQSLQLNLSRDELIRW